VAISFSKPIFNTMTAKAAPNTPSGMETSFVNFREIFPLSSRDSDNEPVALGWRILSVSEPSSGPAEHGLEISSHWQRADNASVKKILLPPRGSVYCRFLSLGLNISSSA